MKVRKCIESCKDHHLNLCIVYILTSVMITNTRAAQISIDEVHNTAIVAVQRYDSTNRSAGYGSGVILWNYSHSDSVYLLTARHILDNRDSVNLFFNYDKGGLKPLLSRPVPVRNDTLGELYKRFVKSDGKSVDLALLSINKDAFGKRLKGFKVLSRSTCIFSDSVYVGDRVLVLGFASVDTFKFVRAGSPLGVSGIISYKGTELYMIDKRLHSGMSGGVVLKEIPFEGKYGYSLVGLVVAEFTMDPDYSWVVKLDYIDSILVKETGKNWDKH